MAKKLSLVFLQWEYPLRKDMKDTVSESIEIFVTVSNSFKDFNFVVTPLGKSVGNRRWKWVKNTCYPVDHSLSTFFKFFNAAFTSSINPFRKSSFRRISVIAVKYFKKFFLVEMSSRESGWSIQNNIYLLFLFISKIIKSFEEKFSWVFEVNAVLFAEFLLNIFSNAVKCPEYLSYPMVFINNLIGIFKQMGSYRSIRFPHIADKGGDFISLWLVKLQKVCC